MVLILFEESLVFSLRNRIKDKEEKMPYGDIRSLENGDIKNKEYYGKIRFI